MVALLLAVLGVVVLAELPAESGMPAVARTRLDEYLAALYPSGDVQVQVAVRARHARFFDATMSGRVFGDSAYYQTDLGPVRVERDGLLPLPYPPREVWCVLLNDSSAQAWFAVRVVFPALHMDMYNADWLVHEAAPDQDMLQTLDTIGCALPLE
jgi:hypothetical protein